MPVATQGLHGIGLDGRIPNYLLQIVLHIK
jgi:hypothetical protein